MKVALICSPYAGDIAANVAYARAAVSDSLARGEAPICGHLLYTQPGVVTTREQGLAANLTALARCDVMAVYMPEDSAGLSAGMNGEIDTAGNLRVPVEYRILPRPSEPADVTGWAGR